MRRVQTVLLVLLIGALAPSSPAFGQTEGVGFGASIGVTNGTSAFNPNPVGINAKAWISDRQAISGMTSFYIGGPDASTPSYWVIQGDFLFHNFNELDVGEGFLALYVGAGGQFAVFEAPQTTQSTRNHFSLRVPLGISYMLGSAPIDVFAEIAPALRITDPAALRFDGAIGFRYFLPTGSGSSSDGSESSDN